MCISEESSLERRRPTPLQTVQHSIPVPGPRRGGAGEGSLQEAAAEPHAAAMPDDGPASREVLRWSNHCFVPIPGGYRCTVCFRVRSHDAAADIPSCGGAYVGAAAAIAAYGVGRRRYQFQIPSA